jgi:hypothetical protein
MIGIKAQSHHCSRSTMSQIRVQIHCMKCNYRQ